MSRQAVEPQEVDAINIAVQIHVKGIEVRHGLTSCA
jgi:hypothetical protein